MTLDRTRPQSLLFIGATGGLEALRPLIVDPAATCLAAVADGLLVSRAGADRGAVLTIGPPPDGVGPSAWTASWINRFARAIPAPIRAPEPPAPQTGVLIVKPGFALREATLAQLAERLAEVGYRIAEQRLVDPAEIREGQLVRRHYAAHWALAETGALSAAEQLRLLEIYQTPAFTAATGYEAGACEVVAAHAFARTHGIDPATIAAWSRAAADAHGLNSGSIHGSNEIGDLAAVTMLHRAPFYDGRPVFLVNPHILTVALWYEEATRPLPVLRVEAAHAGALPWHRLRAEVCGASDPATAWPGSLRRDVREGVLPLEIEAGVSISRLRNAVHLSNGPIEGLRETCIWFARQPAELATARELAAASGWTFDQLMEATRCNVEGRDRVVVEATNGCSVDAAAVLLRASPPVRRPASNRHTFERLALARAVSRRLQESGGVRAVLASGSVARGRCSADSDVDLVVLGDRVGVPIERLVERGITVEVTYHVLDELLAELAAMTGSMCDVKRASRLSTALPLHDPDDLHRAIRRAADAVRPDVAELRDLVESARSALADMRADRGADTMVDAARARALCDVTAYLLIASSPIRYQKPKWVIDDLRLLDERDAIDLLARHYRLRDDPAGAAGVIDACGEVIARVAAVLDLPSFAQARRAGLIEAAPEYSFLCQCLDDARSLLGDGKAVDADYAAKFAGKMAICLLQDSDVDPCRANDIARDHDRLFVGSARVTDDDLDRLERLVARCADDAA